MTMRCASQPVSIVTPCLRAASAKANVVALGSAKPEPGSYAAAPMSSTFMSGEMRRSSSFETRRVSIPMRCCMATLAAMAWACSGPTTSTKPAASKPQSPPTTLAKSRKTLRLSQARRDSASLV